jgi:thymidylate kinase
MVLIDFFFLRRGRAVAMAEPLCGRLPNALELLCGCVLWIGREGSELWILAEPLRRAEELLRSALGRPLWRIARPHRLELAYDDRRIHLVDRLEWRGAEFADGVQLRRRSVRSDTGVPMAAPPDAAIVMWLASSLTGTAALCHDLERAVIEAVTRDGSDLQVLREAAGAQWALWLTSAAARGRVAVPPHFVPALRRAVVWRAFRAAPGRTLLAFLRQSYAELALRWHPPVGWVALLGVDGSGKSSVCLAVQARLSRRFGGSVARHWRPGLVFTSKSARNATPQQPHSMARRGTLSSALKLVLLALDWALGDLLLIRPNLAAARLVIFDRHYVDLLVDPSRYRYGGPQWLASLVARFIPSPDLWVVLDGAPELVRARKDELGIEELARLRAGYLRLAATLENAHVVDVAHGIDEVAERVAQLILDMVSGRTARYASVV